MPRQRVEAGQRLVEDQQPGPPGQGESERELGLLAAGRSATSGQHHSVAGLTAVDCSGWLAMTCGAR
jgi:hypothetical protein